MDNVRLKLTKLIRLHGLNVKFQESSTVVSQLGGGGKELDRELEVESVTL